MMNRIKALILALMLGGCAGQVFANDEILVQGKEVVLTRQQFENALKRLDPPDRQAFLSKEQRVFTAVKNHYLTQVAIHRAKQEGWYDSEKMQALIDKAIGDAVLQEMYRRYQKDNGLKDLDKLAQDYYTAHKEDFLLPEQVSASHILIDTKKRTKEQAKRRAEEARQALLAGKKLEHVALAYSDDPSVEKNKGFLGFFTRDSVVKPFADASFVMQQKGEISPVVETEYGYHVIVFHERKPKEYMPFEQAKPNIVKKIIIDDEARLQQRFMESLLESQDVQVNQEAIRKLVVTE